MKTQDSDALKSNLKQIVEANTSTCPLTTSLFSLLTDLASFGAST